MTTAVTTKTQGTTLSITNSVPAAVTMGEVTSVSGLSAPSKKIDVTSFADTIVTYLPGRRAVGTFVIDLNLDLDDVGQIAARAHWYAQTKATFVLVLPEGTLKTITFDANIMNFTQNAVQNDIWKGQITLEVITAGVVS